MFKIFSVTKLVVAGLGQVTTVLRLLCNKSYVGFFSRLYVISRKSRTTVMQLIVFSPHHAARTRHYQGHHDDVSNRKHSWVIVRQSATNPSIVGDRSYCATARQISQKNSTALGCTTGIVTEIIYNDAFHQHTRGVALGYPMSSRMWNLYTIHKESPSQYPRISSGCEGNETLNLQLNNQSAVWRVQSNIEDFQF